LKEEPDVGKRKKIEKNNPDNKQRGGGLRVPIVVSRLWREAREGEALGEPVPRGARRTRKETITLGQRNSS